MEKDILEVLHAVKHVIQPVVPFGTNRDTVHGIKCDLSQIFIYVYSCCGMAVYVALFYASGGSLCRRYSDYS